MPNRIFTPYEQTQLARHNMARLELPSTELTPVEYLTGRVTFCGHGFSVSPDVLIPRPETEQLASLVVKRMLDESLPKPTLVEVGTGSGALGISITIAAHQHQLQPTVTLTDISSPALAVAKANAHQLLPDHLPTFLSSDLLGNPALPQTIDYLVANLPYIPSHRIASLPVEVTNYEPHLALDGGPDGTELIKRLLHQAQAKLAKNGWLFLEIDESHTLTDFTKFNQAFAFSLVPDAEGKTRFLVGQRRN